MRNSKTQFIRSLGFLDEDPDDRLYVALMLQPRIVGAVTIVGVLLQSPWLFVVLSAALAWSALIPARSVFDAIYNYVVARPQGLAPMPAAPAPRRFAGGLAAMVTLAIGVALVMGAVRTAWALEALLIMAVATSVFGRKCAAADLYNTLSQGRVIGRRASALR